MDLYHKHGVTPEICTGKPELWVYFILFYFSLHFLCYWDSFYRFILIVVIGDDGLLDVIEIGSKTPKRGAILTVCSLSLKLNYFFIITIISIIYISVINYYFNRWSHWDAMHWWTKARLTGRSSPSTSTTPRPRTSTVLLHFTFSPKNTHFFYKFHKLHIPFLFYSFSSFVSC